MNKNKGFIGLGLLMAIVFGVAVVGGGAYYLGKGSNNVEVISPENVLPNIDNQKLSAVENQQLKNAPVVSTTCTSDKGNSMTFQKALEFAKASSCNNIGIFTGEYSCNKNAGGLVDVYMKPSDKPNCGFACRVSIDTGKAEEGWMCTGAMLPTEKTFSSTDYGFSFNYPSNWKLSEDKNKQEVTVSTNDTAGGVDGRSYPSWSISFKSTDKTFFNSVSPTKMGLITYNEKESAVFADDRCLKAEKLLGGIVQAVRYGGSLMSDPAYSNSAVLTTNGKVIIVNSQQGVAITPEVENQLSVIFNSLKLLNGDTVFVPACAK